jgi:two-component system, NtrC family, response regulator PilR
MPKRKILIVEDDPELRQLLVDLCDVLSIATVTADNVPEARQILRRERVSEVITDSLQGDWKKLVRLVRKQVGNIPITLWTADTPYQQAVERLGVCFVDQNRFELLPLLSAQDDAGT